MAAQRALPLVDASDKLKVGPFARALLRGASFENGTRQHRLHLPLQLLALCHILVQIGQAARMLEGLVTMHLVQGGWATQQRRQSSLR
eukprot:CAMPEP_0177435114 /NCGR_PEP_ID=MMETSP0369-20130122/884_1 /TAXON_ID=447022 ORGANISM="Scrippsiella hangoei-like, Strain SHHI-4" /NCGR_SAMPLE_ID=MMETSP0369 /ASSEMBLY_ACC=CAM_ASM_000364 /LENGTH=87 /DNA_ID=CAMNT_0018906263 /DNA_START=221 /DNA_END=480 /DNA_ORIENTATION=-